MRRVTSSDHESHVLNTPSCYECAAPPHGQTESPCGFASAMRLIGQKCRAMCTIAQLPMTENNV